jgi:Rad3-related DNA helicase
MTTGTGMRTGLLCMGGVYSRNTGIRLSVSTIRKKQRSGERSQDVHKI